MGGWFFSLDGLDGTGKSTQCRLLAECRRRPDHYRVLDANRPVAVIQQEIRQEAARVLERLAGEGGGG